MRKKIYNTVHIYQGSAPSVIYKCFMIVFTLLSLLPLMVKERPWFFDILEIACLCVFIIDFILRWITADYKFNNHSVKSFLKYPFRFISIIDLLSIFALIISVFDWLVGHKIAYTLAVFRVIRIVRYSKSARRILDIFKQSRKPLMAVVSLAVSYIFISAIIMFNAEPQSFDTFFDAIYWSTVSLTTVGYGDIYPVTDLGRTIAMLSSFFGIAIVALPAGIVTAEYLNSLRNPEE